MVLPVNKSWNWTQADSNRAVVVLDKLETLIPLWETDVRYAPFVPMLRNVVDSGREVGKLVLDYLAVQGT